MEIDMKAENIAIGNRLREARHNVNVEKAEMARLFNVSEDHYRKLEAGVNTLTMDKVLLLDELYGIDPTYLLTGRGSFEKDFDFDQYIANISTEARNRFVDRMMAYISKMVKK